MSEYDSVLSSPLPPPLYTPDNANKKSPRVPSIRVSTEKDHIVSSSSKTTKKQKKQSSKQSSKEKKKKKKEKDSSSPPSSPSSSSSCSSLDVDATSSRKRSLSLQELGAKRKLVITELFESEKEYVNHLAVALECFVQPMRRQEGCTVDKAWVPQIFRNIELIHSVNSTLYVKLAQCLMGKTNENGLEIDGIGELFLEMVRQLRCYQQYADGQKDAMERLAELRRHHKSFNSFIESREAEKKVTLVGMLEAPLQRCRQYTVQLRKLRKFTPEDHTDYVPLEKTLPPLLTLNTHLNELKSAQIELGKLEQISRRLHGYSGEFAQENRVLLREASLDKRNPKGKMQKRQFFLCNDILMWAEKKIGRDQYQYRGQLPLNAALVSTIPDQGTKFGLQIVRMDVKKNYAIFYDTEAERNRWLKELEGLINGFLQVQQAERDLKLTQSEPVPLLVAQSVANLSTPASSSIAPSPTLSRALSNLTAGSTSPQSRRSKRSSRLLVRSNSKRNSTSSLSTASPRVTRSGSDLPPFVSEQIRLRTAAEEQLQLHRRILVAEDDVTELVQSTALCRARYQALAKSISQLEPTPQVSI